MSYHQIRAHRLMRQIHHLCPNELATWGHRTLQILPNGDNGLQKLLPAIARRGRWRALGAATKEPGEISEIWELTQVESTARTTPHVGVRWLSTPLKRRTKNEPRLAVPSCHGRRWSG